MAVMRSLAAAAMYPEIAVADVEAVGDDPLHGFGQLDRLAYRTPRPAAAARDGVRAVALHLCPQERVFGRGHHQHLAGAGAVRCGERARHGSFALHDQRDMLVVGEHVVHHALHRVEPDDILHEAFARTVCLGAVSRQQFQDRGIGHQRQDEDEQQQHERQEGREDAGRREVHVPLLAIVRGIEHVETAFAEKPAPPCPYGFEKSHRFMTL